MEEADFFAVFLPGVLRLALFKMKKTFPGLKPEHPSTIRMRSPALKANLFFGPRGGGGKKG